LLHAEFKERGFLHQVNIALCVIMKVEWKKF